MASFSSAVSVSAVVIREALAALPPCASTHSILDFTGTYSFPPLLRKWYPHCKITVHVPDLQRAVALRVLHFGLGSSRYQAAAAVSASIPPPTAAAAVAASKSKSLALHLAAEEQYVRVQSRLHATRRSLVFKLLRVPKPASNEYSSKTNASGDLTNIDGRAPAADSAQKVATSPTAFHRILATVSMRGYICSGDRTLHNYCTGLLASLAAGGVCVLFHDGECNTAIAESYLGLVHSDDVDGDADAATAGDEPNTARTSSVEWLLALEAVGFASVEICFQRGVSFVIAARAPSHESWDAWLAQEPAAHSRSFHAQRLTLGRRNALGERLTDWEAKVYEATRPQPKHPSAVVGEHRSTKEDRNARPKFRFSNKKSGETQHHERGATASELKSSEMPIGFQLSPRDEMLDFSALFNGSVDEAMKAIEAGPCTAAGTRLKLCSTLCSARSSRFHSMESNQFFRDTRCERYTC